MTPSTQDTIMHAAFASARALEPTDAEVARVLSRVDAGARRTRRSTPLWLKPMTVGVAVLIALCGGGYAAAPPVRAAIDDAARVFSGWLSADAGESPGRPLLQSEQAPRFLRDPRYADDPRVIAEADGYRLVVAREPGSDMVVFDLGDTGVGLTYAPADFDGHALSLLGPGAVDHADEHGHVPLFGVIARRVTSVELIYAAGPSLRVDGVADGFVLLAEPGRRPRAVAALDARGRELERISLDFLDWSGYGPPAQRVPTRCLPGVVGTHPPRGCPNAR